MSNLLRLRRAIRDGEGVQQEVQEFLDALDVIHLMQSDIEEQFAQGHWTEEQEWKEHLEQSTNLLVNTMVHSMPSVGVDGLLAKLIEEKGYARVAEALADWKKACDARVAEEEDALGDLDDHPF